MKRFFAASIAFAFSFSLPAFSSPSVPNWSGLYVGGHVGYAAVCTVPACLEDDTVLTEGRIVGFQIGHNWQVSYRWVLGIEVDVAKSYAITEWPFAIYQVEKLNYLGTARARVGYAHGRALYYLTGGFAWGDYKKVSFGDEEIATLTGLAAGAGIEWMFAPSWSAKLDFLIVGFGRRDFFDWWPFSFDHHIFAVRAGVNYHFDVASTTTRQAQQTSGWSGYYVGFHGAYADGMPTILDGAAVGFQVGRNWQLSSTSVVGLEADLAATDIKNPNENVRFSAVGTVRARAGFTNGDVLIYATGGMVFGNNRWTIHGLGSDRQTHFGYVVGAGVEVALTRNWSAKFEYLYFDFSPTIYQVSGLTLETPNVVQFGVPRLGLNYRF